MPWFIQVAAFIGLGGVYFQRATGLNKISAIWIRAVGIPIGYVLLVGVVLTTFSSLLIFQLHRQSFSPGATAKPARLMVAVGSVVLLQVTIGCVYVVVPAMADAISTLGTIQPTPTHVVFTTYRYSALLSITGIVVGVRLWRESGNLSIATSRPSPACYGLMGLLSFTQAMVLVAMLALCLPGMDL